MTGRRLVISRHARDLGQSNLPDPAAVELSQALVRLPGERDGFVEAVEHRQEPGPREQRERPGRRGQQLVELRQRLGRRSRPETECELDPEETRPLLAREPRVLERLLCSPGPSPPSGRRAFATETARASQTCTSAAWSASCSSSGNALSSKLLELVGRALVEVEPVVAGHRAGERLAGRVALGSRSLGRRLDDLLPRGASPR